MSRFPRGLLGVLLLTVLSLATFWPVMGHPFSDLDDRVYVIDNTFVNRGLTVETVTWALTTPFLGSWAPVTVLSHALDVELFGLRPAGHHVVNVILHVAASLLFFLFLRSWTGEYGLSLAAAALFAVVPVHVEPVAWIASRKDLLSAVGMLGSLAAYVRYRERPSSWMYGLSLAAFAFALLAKPALFVGVLALATVVAVSRPAGGNGDDPERPASGLRGTRHHALRLLPFLILAAVAALLSMGAQERAGLTYVVEPRPLASRLGQAAVYLVEYLRRSLWPTGLAFHNPTSSEAASALGIAGAVLILVIVSVAAVRARKVHGGILAGWALFLLFLIPYLQLRPVGVQVIADRWAYVAVGGLFLSLGAVGRALAHRSRGLRRAMVVVVVGSVCAFAVASRAQLEHWESPQRAWERVIEIHPDDGTGYAALGHLALLEGRFEDAMTHHKRALQLNPLSRRTLEGLMANPIAVREPALLRAATAPVWSFEPRTATEHRDLASMFIEASKSAVLSAAVTEQLGSSPRELALQRYRTAMELAPGNLLTLTAYAKALLETGQVAPADELSRRALAAARGHRQHLVRGLVLFRQGHLHAALEHLERSRRLYPSDPFTEYQVGLCHLRLGDLDSATRHLANAVWMAPREAEYRAQLGEAWFMAGRHADALTQMQAAFQLAPTAARAVDIGVILARLQRLDQAREYFRRALLLDPENEQAATALELLEAKR